MRERESLPGDHSEAADQCWRTVGGNLCTVSQFAGFFINVTRSTNYWLGDRAADDRAIYLNSSTNRDNFDGARAASDKLDGYYCCLPIHDY